MSTAPQKKITPSPFDIPSQAKELAAKPERKFRDDDGILYTLISEMNSETLRVRRDIDAKVFTFDAAELDEI